MRFPFLLSFLFISLAGCASTPPPAHTRAEDLVDEQIAQGANAISLAQLRLHQTSAAQQATSLTGHAPATQPPALLSGTGGLVASSQSPGIVKVLAQSPDAAPAKVVVVEIPAPAPKPPLVMPTPAKPVSALAPPVVKPVQEKWVVSPTDVTLRRVLIKWAERSGWQLVWDASVDVPVTVNATIEGDFKTAVKRLFLSLSASDVNLNVLLYTGNRVLRVTESGRRAQ